jgi:hypothetical protein
LKAEFEITVADANNASGRKRRKKQYKKAVAKLKQASSQVLFDIQDIADQVRMLHAKVAMRSEQNKKDDIIESNEANLANKVRASKKRRRDEIDTVNQEMFALKYVEMTGVAGKWHVSQTRLLRPPSRKLQHQDLISYRWTCRIKYK